MMGSIDTIKLDFNNAQPIIEPGAVKLEALPLFLGHILGLDF